MIRFLVWNNEICVIYTLLRAIRIDKTNIYTFCFAVIVKGLRYNERHNDFFFDF